jgi:hypothetical protein
MLEKASPLYEEVLVEREKKLGRDHRDTLKVKSYLRCGLFANGQA